LIWLLLNRFAIAATIVVISLKEHIGGRFIALADVIGLVGAYIPKGEQREIPCHEVKTPYSGFKRG
jgi:hypothetical protein